MVNKSSFYEKNILDYIGLYINLRNETTKYKAIYNIVNDDIVFSLIETNSMLVGDFKRGIKSNYDIEIIEENGEKKFVDNDGEVYSLIEDEVYQGIYILSELKAKIMFVEEKDDEPAHYLMYKGNDVYRFELYESKYILNSITSSDKTKITIIRNGSKITKIVKNYFEESVEDVELQFNYASNVIALSYYKFERFITSYTISYLNNELVAIKSFVEDTTNPVFSYSITRNSNTIIFKDDKLDLSETLNFNNENIISIIDIYNKSLTINRGTKKTIISDSNGNTLTYTFEGNNKLNTICDNNGNLTSVLYKENNIDIKSEFNIDLNYTSNLGKIIASSSKELSSGTLAYETKLSPISKKNESFSKVNWVENLEYIESYNSSGKKESVNSYCLFLPSSNNNGLLKLEIKIKYYNSSNEIIDENDTQIVNLLGGEDLYYMFSSYSRFDYTKSKIFVKCISGTGLTAFIIHKFNKSNGITNVYDEYGLLSSRVNNNQVINYYYDILGRSTSVNNISTIYKNDETIIKDGKGNEVVKTKENGLTKSEKRYYKGNLISSTNYYYFSGTNRIQTLIDDTGTYSYTYDLKGRIVEKIRSGFAYRSSYNTGVNFNPLDRKTTTAYDGNNLLGRNEVSEIKVGESGNSTIKKTIMNNSYVASVITSDTYKRISNITLGGNLLNTFTYDNNYPTLISSNNDKTYTYNSFGLLTSVIKSNQVQTEYFYDDYKNLIRIEHNNQIKNYFYDSYGNLEKSTSNITNSTINYSYNDYYGLKGFSVDEGHIVEYSYKKEKSQNLEKFYSLFMGNKEIYVSHFNERIENETDKTMYLHSSFMGNDICSEFSGYTNFEYKGLKGVKLSNSDFIIYDLLLIDDENGFIYFSNNTTNKFMAGCFVKVTSVNEVFEFVLMSLQENSNSNATHNVLINNLGELIYKSGATEIKSNPIDWSDYHLLNLVIDYEIGRISIYVDGEEVIYDQFGDGTSNYYYELQNLCFGYRSNNVTSTTAHIIAPHFSNRSYFNEYEMKNIKKVFDEQLALYGNSEKSRSYVYDEVDKGNDLILFNNNMVSKNNIHPINEPFYDEKNKDTYFTYDSDRHMYVLRTKERLEYNLDLLQEATISIKTRLINTSNNIVVISDGIKDRIIISFYGTQIGYSINSNSINGAYSLSNRSIYHDITLSWKLLNSSTYSVKIYVDGVLINTQTTYVFDTPLSGLIKLKLGNYDLLIQKAYIFKKELLVEEINNQIINESYYLTEKIYSDRNLLTNETVYKNDVSIINKIHSNNIKNLRTSTTNVLKNGNVIYNYEYDNFNRLTKRVIFGNEYDYVYDNLNRLVSEYIDGNETQYTFDNYGNILSITKNGVSNSFQYDNCNRLVGGSNLNIQYTSSSSDGFLYPYIIETSSNLNLFTWTDNKLSKLQVTRNSDNYNFEETYIYNENGLRVRKLHSSSTKNIESLFEYDIDSRLIKEIRNENNSTNTLIYLYDENNELYGFSYNNEKYYYLRDASKEINAIINSSGYLVCRYVYEAYGKHKVLNALGVEVLDSTFIGNINPIRYKGYYYDVETQLYWVSSRYYSPELCRWISPDSIEYLDPSSINGLNLYSYANNNPINIHYNTTLASAGIVGSEMVSSIGSSVGGGSSSSSRNLPSVPGWLETLSTAIEHSFSIINPIRTAGYIAKYPNLWNVMRIDGVTELPGTLSKVATGVGWGIGIIGGIIAGYEKYASGASLSSSIAGGLINAGISIGGMYASTAIATAAMGALAASSLAIPGGLIVVGGAVIAVVAGVAINHLFTKLEIGGNTIEGHLNDFVDWLIFWD